MPSLGLFHHFPLVTHLPTYMARQLRAVHVRGSLAGSSTLDIVGAPTTAASLEMVTVPLIYPPFSHTRVADPNVTRPLPSTPDSRHAPSAPGSVEHQRSNKVAGGMQPSFPVDGLPLALVARLPTYLHRSPFPPTSQFAFESITCCRAQQVHHWGSSIHHEHHPSPSHPPPLRNTPHHGQLLLWIRIRQDGSPWTGPKISVCHLLGRCQASRYSLLASTILPCPRCFAHYSRLPLPLALSCKQAGFGCRSQIPMPGPVGMGFREGYVDDSAGGELV